MNLIKPEFWSRKCFKKEVIWTLNFLPFLKGNCLDLHMAEMALIITMIRGRAAEKRGHGGVLTKTVGKISQIYRSLRIMVSCRILQKILQAQLAS